MRDPILATAREAHPLETGGVLMGYRVADEVVVQAVIGPGPLATHSPDHFKPDYEFQQAEIERIYAETGGRQTYLGDWHTHPGQAQVRLSGADKTTLRRIASCSEARAARPLMLILGGGPDTWAAFGWMGDLQPLFGWSRLRCRRIELKVHGERD